jgi:hypothetical protein
MFKQKCGQFLMHTANQTLFDRLYISGPSVAAKSSSNAHGNAESVAPIKSYLKYTIRLNIQSKSLYPDIIFES